MTNKERATSFFRELSAFLDGVGAVHVVRPTLGERPRFDVEARVLELLEEAARDAREDERSAWFRPTASRIVKDVPPSSVSLFIVCGECGTQNPPDRMTCVLCAACWQVVDVDADAAKKLLP